MVLSPHTTTVTQVFNKYRSTFAHFLFLYSIARSRSQYLHVFLFLLNSVASKTVLVHLDSHMLSFVLLQSFNISLKMRGKKITHLSIYDNVLSCPSLVLLLPSFVLRLSYGYSFKISMCTNNTILIRSRVNLYIDLKTNLLPPNSKDSVGVLRLTGSCIPLL